MLDDSCMADSDSLGLDARSVEALLTRARREVDEGLLPGVQVALARHGRIGVLASFGEARDDSLICLFSATKAITSAAAWLLLQEGRLDLHVPVAEVIPEFASNGKDAVTVEQLFVHTAGFPNAPFAPLDWLDPQRRLERFAQWRLDWPPGSRFEYHATSSMWVIAELMERLSGCSYRDFLRQRLCEPLGLDELYVGLPEALNHRVLDNVHVGDALISEDYRRLGLPEPPQTEVTEEAILDFNRPEIRAVGVPGGGAIASAAELALFYQALLHGGLAGHRLWTDDTLQRVRRIRSGDLRDPVLGYRAERGLGIIVAGDEQRSFRGFGKTNSPLAFGHNGAGGQLAWADPATGLSLAYCTNGHDRNAVRQGRRGVAIGSLAAQCVRP